jgi:hypothetical protein
MTNAARAEKETHVEIEPRTGSHRDGRLRLSGRGDLSRGFMQQRSSLRETAYNHADRARQTRTRGGVMDVGKLLEKIIAQNEIIIRQNEKLLLLIAARANKRDAELLAELKKINRRQD